MVDVEDILKRFAAAESRKTNWDTLYQEAMDFAAPHRQIYYNNTDGQDKSNVDKVFDGTAADALDGFVSNTQSALTPPGEQWCSLVSGSRVDKNATDPQLEKITKAVFDYIRNSNFDSQISTTYADLAVGCGALMVTKGTKENPLHFTSVHIAELYLEEGPLGRIDTAFRKYSMPARNIKLTWDDADIPDTIEKQAKDSPDNRRELIEATLCEYKEEYNKKTEQTEKVKKYTYCVIDKATKSLLVEREQKSSPWIIFRWPTLPGEIYARGPLLKALPDIKVLNKIKELLLKKGSRDIYGVYTSADDSVININNVQFGSMCVIPVESNGGARGPSLMPLPSAGDVNFAQFIFNEIQQSIQKRMFAEPLGRVDLPVKSATEVALRQQDYAKKTGSAFGKLEFETMIPLMDRILYILDELGLIDMGNYKIDGQTINLKYQSPLAKAKDMQDFQNYQAYATFMKQIYGDQVMLAFAPPDKSAPYLAEKLSISKDLLPTQADVDTYKQALMQQLINQQVGAGGGAGMPGDPNAAPQGEPAPTGQEVAAA